MIELISGFAGSLTTLLQLRTVRRTAKPLGLGELHHLAGSFVKNLGRPLEL
jgi:hypothetical protein